MSDKKPFDPTPYLKDLNNSGRGPARMYLPAAARVMWFRYDYPAESGWQLTTDIVSADPVPVVKAYVTSPEGRVIATGHAMCAPVAGKTYSGREIEKAETSAIGRALSSAGYGTQFALEVDAPEGDVDFLADAPQPPVQSAGTPAPSPFPAPVDVKLNKWKGDVSAMVRKASHPYWSSPEHVSNAINGLLEKGAINPAMTVRAAASVLTAYADMRANQMSSEEAIAKLTAPKEAQS